MKCLDQEGKATVAGILFFATAPQRWLPDARISAVRFRETTVSNEFLDRKELEGRLPQQIDAAAAFLTEHVRAPSRVEAWDRNELGIPALVLREALINAVTHRDYRMASQVRIFVFDDRVEILNPGDLLNRLTIDNIRLGITQRRNPLIASLLSRMFRRENIGRGIPDMIRLMRERGLPEPEFSVEGGHFGVVLRGTPQSQA